MRKFILVAITIIGFLPFCQAQSEGIYATTHDFQDVWVYIELQDTIQVKVVKHYDSIGLCGSMAFASMTIVETDKNQQIRLLDLCGTNLKIKKDQRISIKPAQTPSFSVSLPISLESDKNYGYQDDLVINTTWCTIISNE